MNFEQYELETFQLELLQALDTLVHKHFSIDPDQVYTSFVKRRNIAHKLISDAFKHFFLNIASPGIELFQEGAVMRRLFDNMSGEQHTKIYLWTTASTAEKKDEFFDTHIDPLINVMLNKWMPVKEEAALSTKEC